VVIDTSDVEKATSGLGGFGAKIGGAAKVAGLALAGAGVAAAGFGIKAAAQMETLGTSFTGIMGNATDAQAYMKRLADFAAKTPFDLPGVATGAQRLMAMGQSGDQAISTLTTIGNSVAAIGGGSEEINGVVVALTQMSAKGKFSAEEMNQISERMPNLSRAAVFDEIGKKMGVTGDKAREMADKGLVPASVGVDAITEAMKKVPGAAGAMDAQAKTLAGSWSTFKDTLNQSLGTAFTPILPVLSKALTGISDAIGPLLEPIGALFTGMIEPLIPAIGALAKAFTPLMQALGPVGEILGGAVADALDGILPGFTELLAAIMPLLPVLAELAGNLLSAVALVLGKLMSALAPVITVLVQFAGALIDALMPFLPTIAVALAKVAEAVGTLLMALLPLLPAILQILTAFLPLIPVVAQLATLLAQLVVALSPVIEWIAKLAAILVGVLTQALAGIIKMVADFVTKTIEFISRLASDAPAKISDMVNSISQWFGQLPGRVGGAVNSMVSSVTGAFSGLWSKVTSGVTSGIGDIVSGFSGLGSKITGALSGAASNAWNAGWSIINSMGEGIAAAGRKVVEAAQAIVQKVKDLLPHSPAKTGPFSGKGYPLYSGMAIGNSLAEGLNRSAGGVVSAMNSLLSPVGGSVSVAATTTATGPTNGAGSGGVQVRVFIGDRELTDIVRVEVGGANSRTATALVGGSV
jgi:tape measure domain-containing protein